MTQFEIGSETGEAVIIASHSKKLKDADDQDIKKLIAYIFALIGLKAENLPSDLQKVVLINFIRNDLGAWGVEEVKQAFHLLASKKLNMDPKHYQNFSAIYLGEVMCEYQKVKSSAYKDYRIAEQNAEKQSVDSESNAEKIERTHDFVRECIIKPWKYFLKTGTITFGIIPYNVIYRNLTDVLGLIDIPVPEKKEIFTEAVKIARGKVYKVTNDKTELNKIRYLKGQIELNGFEKAMDYEIKEACYEISVKRFFEKSKEENVDLEQIIETWIKNSSLK